MTSISLGQLSSSSSFSYSGGSGFTYAVRYLYAKDLNGDGLDEVIFAGFETQPNVPATYTNTQVSIFGWSNGKFINLTSQWLPNDANSAQAVGDIVFGDFNKDGRIDAYLSGNADMEYPVHSYVYLNQGNYFIKQDLGLTNYEHGASAGDINADGYDDVVVAAYINPSVFYLGGPNGLTKKIVQEGGKVSSYETFASGVAIADFFGNGTQSLIVVDSAPANKSTSDTRLLKTVADSGGNVLGFQYLSTLPVPRLELPQYGLINTGTGSSSNSHDVRVRAMDFTDDGLTDAIVFSRAGWDGTQWPMKSQVQFLQNLGNGEFSDVTSSRLIGYKIDSNVAYTPIFEDFNLDGLVDIFLSEASFKVANQSTSILLQQQDGTFVDTGRQQLSSYLSASGGMATLVEGPNNQYSLVIENQSRGGNTTISTVPIAFPDRENSENLHGTINADYIYGLGGNDSISGGIGNDIIDGGSGVDKAIFTGKADSYTITIGSTNSVIIDKTTSRDGTDTLANVERLQFTDTMLALDTGANQTAGSGYMLYKAAFNRTPDAVGLGFWINKMDSGMSYDDVSKNFVTSAEFKTAFGGSNPSVNALVTKLYNNVLNRAPDAGGLAFWQDKLNTGWSTADVLGYFSTSGENVTNVTPLIANGIQYQQFVG